MTVGTSSRSPVRKGILYAGGLAILWVVLALFRPTTTYHLAPLLVAGAPPLLAVDRVRDVLRLGLLSLAGMSMALVATLLLSLAAGLEGPSLLPVGGAALESVVFAVIGATGALIIALLVARRRDP